MKCLLSLLLLSLTVSDVWPQIKPSSEAWETSKQLGVAVKDFLKPQGVGGFDEIPDSAPEFKFRVAKRPLTGPTPKPWYETRPIVKASALDGTVYEAFCGRFDPKKIWPGLGESSSNMNPRQQYDPHYGYGFNPADVFIGRREGGRIKTSLFFRDVGSHETAPHYISVDQLGKIHLIVADVNIADDNQLNTYSVIGDPKTGKWLEAWLLDRRGFTSSSHPWTGSWGDTVHYMWDWGDASFDKENPNMGLFYVDRKRDVFGRKVRVIAGLVQSHSSVVDAETGRLVVIAANEDGVFVAARDAKGNWAKPVRLDPKLGKQNDVSISAVGRSFVIRTSANGGREWFLTPGA